MKHRGDRSPSRGDFGEQKGDLNLQMRRFAEAVAAGMSGKDAAVEAGYSPSSAKNRAYKLLQRPDVRVYIAELTGQAASKALESEVGREIVARQEERIAREDLSDTMAEAIVEEFTEITWGDPLPIWEACGLAKEQLDALANCTPAQRRMITKLKQTTSRDGEGSETVTLEITMRDRDRSLRALAQRAGVLVPVKRIEVTGKDGGPIESKEASVQVHLFAPDNGRGPSAALEE